MQDRRARSRIARDRPIYWEPSLLFLKYGIASLVVGAVAVLTAILVLVPDQAMRPLGAATVLLVTLAAWFLFARGRIEAAVYTLAIGMWIAVTGTALFTGGLHSTAGIIYPQIILLLGWFIGTRAALTAALLTVATALWFLLAESWGFLPAPAPTPLAIRWMLQSFVFLFSVVLIFYFVRSYQRRLDEAGDLDRDLNRAQAVARVGSWVYDLASDTMRLSAETCRIFDVPEGTRGSYDTYLARVYPDDRDRLEEAWRTALEAGQSFDHEHRILVGNAIRLIRQVAELEFDPAGKPLRSVGTVQDVTEQRQAENALRKSEDRFHRLAENAPDLIYRYELSPVRGFSYVSPAAIAVTGFTPEEHYADPDLGWKLVHPEDRHLLEEASKDCAPGSKTIEVRWLVKDGSVIWTEQRNLPIFDDAGNLIAVEGMARDITERKRNEDQYHTIIQASIDGFWITDFFGRILDANESVCRMLGYARTELIGMNIRDIDADESPNEIAARTREMKETGHGRFQARHRRKDGAIIDVEVSVMHVAELGQRLFAFVRDITERKRAEAARAEIEGQLRESQKMEALGTLAGGVAHDFNNIVAAIIGNVELARQDVGAAHPALESLEQIRKASRRAKALVQQILAFGRRQVLERKVISLTPVIDESVRLLRSTLPSGIRLDVDCAPDAPSVLADATQIEQVLLNLCSNAWQAMQAQPRAGTIRIGLAANIVSDTPYRGPERRTRGERIPLRPGRYACLTVQDNGPGMDRATRSRIFEPFFTTKPVGEGTGLGLAVVHGIVHDHEGSIAVQSAPGEGAAFRIYFPAAPEPEALDAAHTTEPNPAGAGGDHALVLQGEGKHILYLDDDDAIVFLMTRLLERQGYRVTGYVDAREALAAVRARPGEFDLVVTDYNMPGISGLEVANALKEIRADLPVALASGYITEELREKAPAAGVRELIYKPDTVEDFCRTVARLVNTLSR